MFAISPTDIDWFNYLKERGYNSFVNFWTPTPWNISGLPKDGKLYFMLKSPIRKIGGYGEFVSYENLIPEDAWTKFGYRNGRASKEEFLYSIRGYIEKRSNKVEDNDVINIGCIVLKNCIFWDEVNYKDVNDYEIEFSPKIVKIKYFDLYDPFISRKEEDFSLVNEPKSDKRYLLQVRNGQGEFKGKLLKAYNNSCCITGEITPELLEAVHIQGYKGSKSNHIQNGLLMRVDFHRLYDNNLIFIDENYTINISSLIKNEFYQKYNGLKITLPESEYEYPSVEALKIRRLQFRD